MLASNLLMACEPTGSRAQAVAQPSGVVSWTAQPAPPSAAATAGVGAAPAAADFGPRENHFEYCSRGYRPSGEPRLDVLRLGALCGPSNGMQALQPSWRPQLGEDDPTRRVSVEPGQCVRVVAAASLEQRFELELRRGDESLASCEHTSAGLCPPDRALCSDRAANLEVVLRSDTELSDFIAQLWLLSPPEARQSVPEPPPSP